MKPANVGMVKAGKAGKTGTAKPDKPNTPQPEIVDVVGDGTSVNITTATLQSVWELPRTIEGCETDLAYNLVYQITPIEASNGRRHVIAFASLLTMGNIWEKPAYKYDEKAGAWKLEENPMLRVADSHGGQDLDTVTLRYTGDDGNDYDVDVTLRAQIMVSAAWASEPRLVAKTAPKPGGKRTPKPAVK